MGIPSAKLRKTLERLLGAGIGKVGQVESKSDFRHVIFEISTKTAE